MRAIVTGGAGFIGSHLTELLLSMNHEVIVIDDLRGGREQNLSGVVQNPRFTFVKKDIRDLEGIAPHFQNVDWVFHLAGLADIVPSIERPQDYYEVNVTGTLNVLECARKADVKRLIYAASSSCYGIPDHYPTDEKAEIRPQYPYALTKFLGEELVLHWGLVYNLPVVSLRLFNVYGPRSRTSGTYGAVFGVFLTQKWHGYPFTVVGDGNQTRDFTYVTDVAAAFYAAAQNTVSGEIFNVGSGHSQSINTLVDLLEGPVVHIPKRPGEPDCTFADIQKIQKILGWSPQVPFKEGVAKVLKGIADYKDAPLWDPKTIEKATATWFQHLQTQETKCS